MKVELIEPFGFCAGVEFAIKKAKEIKAKYQNNHVVILGMLVHNLDALNDLKKTGIDVLYEKDKTYLELLNYVKDDDIVILTAHGHPHKVEEILNNRGIKFFDTTCPFVKKTHEIIEKEIKNNHEVIYIGKKNHPEAIAAVSINEDKVHLLEVNSTISSIEDSSPLVVSQTTLSTFETLKQIKKLKENNPNLRVSKTICNSSTLRQEAIRNISSDTDLIIVLGSTFSNNTLTLYNLAKEYHQNAEVIMIENADKFDEKFLMNKKKVAIASGASTSKDLVFALKNKIEQLNN